MVVHDLEQRVLIQVALRLQRFNQLLEWQVLMGLGAERGFAGLIENDLERHAPVDPVAQHLCIYEEADDIFYFNPVTVRYRYADANILLSGITLQQSLEACQQCHEEGRTLALSLALQARNKTGR